MGIIMEANLKAKELVEKFIEHTRVYHEVIGWEDYIDSAKQCALIAQKMLLHKLAELGINDEFENNVLLELNAL